MPIFRLACSKLWSFSGKESGRCELHRCHWAAPKSCVADCYWPTALAEPSRAVCKGGKLYATFYWPPAARVPSWLWGCEADFLSADTCVAQGVPRAPRVAVSLILKKKLMCRGILHWIFTISHFYTRLSFVFLYFLCKIYRTVSEISHKLCWLYSLR
jgi:hypothetical protein